MQNEIYFGRDLISEDDLRHYGMPKRSGRYPWGSGDDPYHHGEDAPGGKRSTSKSDGPKESYFKRRAAKKAAVAKAKQDRIEREVKEERDRQKQEALKSGDPKKLAPFIRDLTDAELRQASDRLRLENEFANRLSEASKYQKTAADKIQAKLDKLNSYTSTGINTWNNYAKIANVFRDAEDQLPVIGEKKKKDKNEDKDKSDNGGNQSKPAKPTKPDKPSNTDEPAKPDTSSKSDPRNEPTKSEEVLSKEWRDEANKIVEEAKRAKAAEDRKEFRREMAEDFSNYLKELDEEDERAKRDEEFDRWQEEAERSAIDARNKYLEDPDNRKEFRRAQAETFSKLLNDLQEEEYRGKWQEEQEDLIERARRKRK